MGPRRKSVATAKESRVKGILATILILCTATAGCSLLGLDDTEERVLEVAPYKGRCFGLFETLCLQVREPGEEDFRNLFETPRRFDYDWGFDYLILVEERELEQVPADASSIRRTVKQVISKEPAAPGTTFELTIPAGALQDDGQGQFTIRAEAALVCPEALPCQDLTTLVQEETRLKLTVAFPDTPGDPMEIQAWLPCPEEFGPCLPV